MITEPADSFASLPVEHGPDGAGSRTRRGFLRRYCPGFVRVRRLALWAMPRAPRITGQQAIRALRELGWQVGRQRGSHVILEHPRRSRTVTVPVHAGETLKPKTLASILEQAGVGLDEFGMGL